jgi:hypothetical protein
MYDLWLQLFDETDWKSKARALFDFVDKEMHPVIGTVVVLILIFVGSKVVWASPKVRRTGLRLSLVTFLLFLGFEWYRADTLSKTELAEVALKAFNYAGFVLAVTWILLPVVSFVLEHMRLALAAFLGYGGYAIVTADNFSSDQLPDIGLRALVAVALTLIVAWIVHPIWDYIHDMLPRPKRRPKREDDEGYEDTEEEQPAEREGMPRRREADESRPSEPAPVEGAVLTARFPMPRVTASVDVVTELEIVSAPQTEDQRRRDRIRLQVEMAYVMATPQLGARLPREAFNELLTRYLGDHLPLEAVEENSRQLLLILQEQQKQSSPSVPPTSVTSVAVVTPPAASTGPATAALEELLRRVLEEQQRVTVIDGQSRFSHPDSATHAAQHSSSADTVPNGMRTN